MRSITARDIQVFVAGAFALAGINGLVGSIKLGASGHYHVTSIIIALFVSALPFGLAIAILAGSVVALRAARYFSGLPSCSGLSYCFLSRLSLLQRHLYMGRDSGLPSTPSSWDYFCGASPAALQSQGLTKRRSEPRPAPMRRFRVIRSSGLRPPAFSGAVADLQSR